MTHPRGFFNVKEKRCIPAPLKKLDLTNQYCSYSAVLALAATIIDKLLSHKISPKTYSLPLLWERHFGYFPPPFSKRVHSGLECFDDMVKTPYELSSYLHALTYTLRQIAVDEMVAHPERYRFAFIKTRDRGPPAFYSPEELRKIDGPLDENALAALAWVLNLPIKIQAVAKDKELPLNYTYPVAEEKRLLFPSILQKQKEHYLPELYHAARFEAISDKWPTLSFVIPSQKQPDPSAEEIKARIAAADKQLLASYEDSKHRLDAMFLAGELDKEQLLTIYIQNLKFEDKKTTGLYPDIAFGSQAFFEHIIDLQQERIPALTLIGLDHRQQSTERLIAALSRELSLGQVDATVVFAALAPENARHSRSF